MTRPSSKNALLVAVLAGLPAVALLGWASPAQAQYQVGGNGHALDANPQVGSGGINGGGGNSARINHNALNSDIITGNVGGLSGFHGRTNGEINPNVFDGRTGTNNSDLLNSIAGPTVGNGGTRTETQLGATPGITPVYPTASFVGTPPPGFTPAATANGNLLVPAPRIDPLTQVDDTRDDPGNDLKSNPTGTPLTIGELDMLTSVDNAGNASFYTFSPLYGVRQMQSANADDTFYQSKFGTNGPAANPNGSVVQPDAIQKMRDELNNNTVPNDESDQNKPVSGAVPLNQASLNSAVGNGGDQTLPNAALNSSLKDTAVTGGLNSGQGMQNEMLVPPAKQSAQLKELERRYAQSNAKPDAQEQTRRFNEERKANAQPDTGSGAPVTPGQPGALPDLGTGNVPPAIKPDANVPPKPRSVLNGPDTSAIDNKPMIITSLATGMPAKGLSDLMKNAEEKMRQGKFTEAIDTYETAQQVARNNPFVYLGRAFAELGSSYYGKADLDLRRAVLIDPAVLSGRYDLNGFLGQDRASFVQKELIDISSHEKGARAYVLLAFVAHNTGNDALAGTDLDEATTRGGYVGLVDEMRSAWGIKAAAPAPAVVPAK